MNKNKRIPFFLQVLAILHKEFTKQLIQILS